MAKDDADGDASGKKPGGKKKIILMIVPILLIGGGAAAFFLLRGGGEEKKHEPVPGLVIPVEPITVNLAGGHFLKIGFALQQDLNAPGGHGAEPDASKATDIVIATLSNMPIDELTSAEDRAQVKEELVEKIAEAYHHEIYDLYFTEFVMQ